MKTDLIGIANIPYRNKLARQYSKSLRKKNSFKMNIVSIIIGIVFGLLIGYFQILNVHAAEFSNQEWVDICYISRVVEAESGNQTELGKRLVADTVLNRLNNGQFGLDVKSIVDAKNQYADGIMASEETIRIVMEEYQNKTDTEVLYFRTDYYHKFATDLFVVGEHYFSK